MGSSLDDKTLGIVGMGRIGLAVAARARGFGLRILYHNRRPSPQADALHARYFARLDDMLPLTNILSLHCPMSPETKNLLDARRLALLPKGAYVVNTARGGHVVDDALIAALRDGHVSGAGLDVYANEPNIDRRYAQLDNVVLLPHLGSATTETRLAMGMMVIDNIDAVLGGHPARNPV
jgi:lactate dehydrogenase-like 2-hydroxyacid dehydrogenase